MKKSKEKVLVRAVCDYQLFGDVIGVPWMAERLNDARDEGKIEGFDVFDAVRGVWGIQFVTFTVDLKIKPAQLEDAKELIAVKLMPIIGDSDIEVRWVGVPS